MRGTKEWFTKAAVVMGLVALPSVSGAGSAMTWTITADTSVYNMDGLPPVSDGSVSDGSVSEDLGTDINHAAQELGTQDEMKELQRFLDEVMGQQDGIQGNFSFWELMRELVKGNLRGTLGQAGTGIQNMLFSEAGRSRHMLFQMMAIGIIGAMSPGVPPMFKDGQISGTGFFVAYILLFTHLAANFVASLQVAVQMLDQILGFMKLMMPAYFMSVAFSRGSMNALMLYEGMLGAVTLVQWIYSTALLSMVKIYVLMILGSHVVKEALLTRLTELLEQAVGWGLKTLTGLTVGFHLIQPMILPYADTAGQAGMKRLLETIPDLGQGVGAMTQMVLGSSILIKDTMRTVAVVILVVITVIPVIKFMVLMVLYQRMAVVIWPVRDKRVMSCVPGAFKGHKLLTQIVLYSMFLSMISITIICASTNVNYFASQSLSEQNAG